MLENPIKENQEKSVCYIRLSQDDPKNPSLSPLNQEKICRDYAKAKGDKILKIYKDINRSGGNLERKSFKQLIEDAKKGLFKRIYVKTWDRLSRDIVDMELTIRKLTKMGIIIFSCAGDNDPRIRQVITMAAQWELDRMRAKTEQLHTLKKSEGIPITRPCFGYHMSKKYKMYFPDGEKALIVKKMFKMRKEGKTITDIAKELKMNAPTIYRMLQNKTYLGYHKYRGEWIKGRHEVLVDEEIFNNLHKL